MRAARFALILTLAALPLSAQSIEWWSKPFDEALAAAKAKPAGQLVLYAWRDDDGNCKAMFGGTLAEKDVAAVLGDFVCMGAKFGEAAHDAVLKKYGVAKVPTVLFLDPDGKVVDGVVGYVPKAEFLTEVQRIKAGTKTLPTLRKAAADAPADLGLQMELVRKLRALGDRAASVAVLDAVVAKEPKALSEPAAEAMLLKLTDQMAAAGDLKDYDLRPLREFLARQKSKRILFLGWDRVASVEWQRDNLRVAVDAAEKAWKYIPPEQVLGWGQNVVAKAYEAWKELEKLDKTILKRVLDVSDKVLKEVEKEHKATPDPAFFANAMYLHAALLNVNNLRKEAFALMDKAIATDPKNDNLKKAKELWMDGSK
ncbi:MAG: thioredoxin family protein [Planctomycetes bacterium]|nr:thioredoxin family protein [Planctomycetota bacterium]